MNHSTKLKSILSISLLFGVLSLSAQYYIEAPDNLPPFAATHQSMDVQSADLDGDGDLDLVLANEFQGNTLMFNSGDAVFFYDFGKNMPQENHDSEDVAAADFNMDGSIDLIFCSEDDVTLGEVNVHEYYMNDGIGFFTENTDFQFTDSKANAVVAVHINGDLFPDVAFGNDGQNFLYINNGDGTFTDETSTRLPSIDDTTQDLNFQDVDNDGDLDLFVGNEDGNRLLINNGEGVFVDESTDRLPQGLNIETRKVSFGDVNGDDSADIFLSNVQFIPGKVRQNRLFLNDGNGYFSDVTASNLPEDDDDTLDAIFEDVDDDEDLDLVIANVNLQTTSPQKFYFNDGEGVFYDATDDVLEQDYFGDALGVIAADLNGNGMNDLYFCERNMGTPTMDYLFLKVFVDPVFSTNEVFEEEAVTVFPNPVTNNFSLEIEELPDEEIHFQLVDSLGKLIFPLVPKSQNEKGFQFSLKDLNLAEGIYFIRLQVANQHLLKKIVFKK